jgi:hypothetical protein
MERPLLDIKPYVPKLTSGKLKRSDGSQKIFTDFKTQEATADLRDEKTNKTKEALRPSRLIASSAERSWYMMGANPR